MVCHPAYPCVSAAARHGDCAIVLAVCHCSAVEVLALQAAFINFGLVVLLELCQSSLGHLFCQGLAARYLTLSLWQPLAIKLLV